MITQVVPNRRAGSIKHSFADVQAKVNALQGTSAETGGPLLGPQKPGKKGLKTLVLDLDETLVHSSFKPHPGRQSDLQVPLLIDKVECKVHVLVRPGALQFVETLAKNFEVVIFTASLAKYAEPLVAMLDKNRTWCSHILFRDHCTYNEKEETFVKDLGRLGRDLKDVIIIDNSPGSYRHHKENALACRSWFSDVRDRELYEFIPILKKLARVEDVRPYLSQIGAEATHKYHDDMIVNPRKALAIVDNLLGEQFYQYTEGMIDKRRRNVSVLPD